MQLFRFEYQIANHVSTIKGRMKEMFRRKPRSHSIDGNFTSPSLHVINFKEIHLFLVSILLWSQKKYVFENHVFIGSLVLASQG